MTAAESQRQAKDRKRAISEVATSLRNDCYNLAYVLEREGVCEDVAPLNNIKCTEKDSSCLLSLLGLLIRLDASSIKCTTASVVQLSCKLSIEIEIPGWPVVQETSFDDPLKHLDVEIVLKGTAQSGEPLVHCWHLDRHPDYVPKPGEKQGITAAHPRYHLHFGGRALKHFKDEHTLTSIGSIMVFDGPRLPHPPMDPVLTIDMILSNFAPAKWLKLRANGDYERLLHTSQSRLWAPYAKAIANHWAMDADPPWKALDPWPHLTARRL